MSCGNRKKSLASRLRLRVKLQDETKTPDGAGGYTRGWTDIAEIWAEMVAISGKEKLYAAQMQSTVTHRATIRFRHGVHAGQRLTFDGRAFFIRYVLSFGNSRETLELFLEERAET